MPDFLHQLHAAPLRNIPVGKDNIRGIMTEQIEAFFCIPCSENVLHADCIKDGYQKYFQGKRVCDHQNIQIFKINGQFSFLVSRSRRKDRVLPRLRERHYRH